MDMKMENDMETGIIQRIMQVGASQNEGYLFGVPV